MDEQIPNPTHEGQVSDTLFNHQPLENSSEQIRLLEVKTQQPEMCLELQLSVHSLADDLHFYAMSYTWGDDEKTARVIVNGRSLMVTKNCHYALTQVQRYYASNFGESSTEGSPGRIYLWIDSICIDQKNNKEKGHQVAMMGRIYGKASKVLACVGPHADDSKMLAEIFNNEYFIYLKRSLARNPISDYLVYDNDHAILRPIKWYLDVYLRNPTLSERSFAIQFRKAFLAFANRNYWSRVWIIQEVAATARDECLLEVFCGSDRFSRAELNLLFYICGHLHKSSDRAWEDLDYNLFARQRKHCFKFVMEKGNSPEISFEDVLFRIDHSFGCRQPEDRVYGALSLMKWPKDMVPIQPVYEPSATFNLAERILSIQLWPLSRVQEILVGLEIQHSNLELDELVRARSSTSHQNQETRQNLPSLRFKEGYHCAILSKNSANQLTAFLVSSDDEDFGPPF